MVSTATVEMNEIFIYKLIFFKIKYINIPHFIPQNYPTQEVLV